MLFRFKNKDASISKILFRDTIFLVLLVVICLGAITTFSLYRNYSSEVKNFKKEYIKNSEQDLISEVNRAFKEINKIQEKENSNFKTVLKDRVHMAHSVAVGIYKTYSQTKSQKEMREILKASLERAYFNNGTGYYFVITTDGTMLMDPKFKELEGKNFLKQKGSSVSKTIAQNMINIALKDGEGTYTYKWYHPEKRSEKRVMETKTWFGKRHKGLDVIIGTGEYESDIIDITKRGILSRVSNLQTKYNGKIWVVDEYGKLLNNDLNKSYNEKFLNLSNGVIKNIRSGGNGFYQSFDQQKKEIDTLSYGVTFKDWGWYIISNKEFKDLETWVKTKKAKFYRDMISQIVLIILTLTLVLFFSIIIIKKSIRRLNFAFREFQHFFANPRVPLKVSKSHESLGFKEFELIAKSTEIISEYHKQLRDEKVNAERALQVKTDFLSNMSHEIRTPMNVIIGMADYMDESKMTVEQKRFLDSFQDACNNLLTILNDILDLSKFESDTFELNNSKFSLQRKLENILNFYTGEANKKGLKLILNYDNTIKDTVEFDQVRLGQVLSNLIGNAMKFTKFGKIELNVKLIGVEGNKQRVHFSVYDTGIGIEEEAKETIFQKFAQADDSVTKSFGGTGLGLAISSRLVNAMGGNLLVDSEIAKFTNFYFEVDMPFLEKDTIEERRSILKQKSFQEVAIEHGHILVVDDTDDNLLLIKKFLSHPHIKITTAANGLEALDLYKSDKFDLVLMDIQMPVLDGYEATKKIREYEELNDLSHTPIFALSAYAMTENIDKSMAAGCDGHISKPIRKKDIQQFVFSKLGHQEAS